jgi:hypothetical protein
MDDQVAVLTALEPFQHRLNGHHLGVKCGLFSTEAPGSLLGFFAL